MGYNVDIKFHCDERIDFKDGFSVRAFLYTDYSIEFHSHDFYEVNVVMSGTGIHCIENGRVNVKRGDVFVIPPMVAHAYEDCSELEVYHILLQKCFVDKNREEAESVNGFLQLTEIEPFIRSNFSNAFYLRLDNSQLQQLKNEIDYLDDNGEFPWMTYYQLKYHTAWKIIYWLSSLLHEQLKSEFLVKDKKYDVQIFRALEYMHRSYGEKITLDSLCKLTFLSRSTFIRCFKDMCNMSPIEYLNRYRCKKASEMLQNPSCTKTEVANICGFYDLSHMERMLRVYNE